MRLGGVLRIGGAMALLVAGLVHLDLYFGGYRNAGSVPNFGRSILLNAIASGVLAVAVAARREWFVRLAGIALPVATLAAFTFTHTGHTLLGFQGDGLHPSPQAQLVLVAEIATIVLLAATFLPSLTEHDDSGGIATLAAAGAIVVVAFAGFGIYWADKYETTAAAGGPDDGGHRRLRVRPAGAHRHAWDDRHLDQQRLARAQRRRHRSILRQQPVRQLDDVPLPVRRTR